jgi:multicomponent Na+:H+ antiporter subunit C
MTLGLAATIAVLVAVGVFLMLRRNLLKLVIGLSVLSHAANLTLVGSGGFLGRRPPVIGDGSVPYVDPLPQALVLTAIVIGFGVSAFLLVLLYRIYRARGGATVSDLTELKG